jgi:hypothetical protein
MDNIAPDKFGPLCDVTLESFAWEQAGRDVTVQLTLGRGAVRRYTFTWADHLSVDIRQDERGTSQPFTSEGGAEKLANGRLRIWLDFAGQGSISLECNEIMADDS